jgi:hypothetical protein
MAAPTEDDIKKLQKQIDELSEKIEEMSGDMDKIDKSSSSISKNIGDSNDLLSDAVLSVKNIGSEFRKFATDSKQQYKYAEDLAKKSKETAVNIGISVGRSQQFTKEFNRATAEVAKFGGSANDVSNIMEEMASRSGRARIISSEEVGNIFKISKSLGITTDSAAELAERMDLMGVSSEKFYEHINQMTIDSQKLGLNSSKVAEQLQNNFQKMSNMSFKNGVKGMTEMAKLAVKMRVDVSDMLGMAEKFYNPEGAIEAAAELQLLGGDIAEAFGDPFETMYLARNKPEELAKKVSEMTENMMQFNEETGEYELPAEAIQQFQALDKQLGIGVDKIIDMSRQASKIKDIKMNVSGNITDEDMREGLAGMAKMKDGKWVVDFKGEELDIGDIGMDQAAEILAAPKDSDDAIMDIAMNSMTTNQILENILEAMKTGYVAETNVYEITEDILRPGMRELTEGIEGQVEKMIEALKDTPVGKIRELMLEQAKALGLDTGDRIKQIFEMDMDEEILTLVNLIPSLTHDLEEILDKARKIGAEDRDPNTDPVNHDFMVRSGGQTTSFTSEDDIIGAKKNGPLDKLMDKSLASNNGGGVPSKIEFGTLDVSGRIELVSPDGSSKNIDLESIKPMIQKTIISHLNGTFRNGGVPSSKETTDVM